tara:strand:+ start:204 stop:1238 length:1035 start_codon:yes stop_codon:yes gene_type:complete
MEAFFPVVNEQDEAAVEAVVAKLVGVGANVAKVRDFGPEVSKASKEIAGSVFGALKENTTGLLGEKRFQEFTEQVYLKTFDNVEAETKTYWKKHQKRLVGKGWSWSDSTNEDGKQVKGFRSACLDSVSNLRIKLVWISYAYGAGKVVLENGEKINFKSSANSYIRLKDATLHGTYSQCMGMLMEHCLPNLNQRFSLTDPKLDEDGEQVLDKDGKVETDTVEYSFTSSEDMGSYQDQLAVVAKLEANEEATYSEVTVEQDLLGRMKDAMVASFKDQDAFKGLIMDGRRIVKLRKIQASAEAEEALAARTEKEVAVSDTVNALLESGKSIEEIQEVFGIVAVETVA